MRKTTIITFLCLVVLTVKAQLLTDWQNLYNNDFVSRITHDENYLYVGSFGGGIIMIDKQTGEQTMLNRANLGTTDNSIVDIVIHDGELWYGTEHFGLAKISDGNTEKFDSRNAGFLTNQHIGGFYFGSDGGMLVGGYALLYQFDGKRVTASFDISPFSPYTYVSSIKADGSGRIWVGCYDAWKVSTLFNFTSEGLVPVSHPYGNINRLETDADGCLWMATDEGLVKYDGADFTAYTPENSGLPESQIMDLMADGQGNLWMVSWNFLTKFDGSHFENYPYQRESALDLLLTIDIDGNDVYVGSRHHGLFHLTGGELKRIPLINNQLIDNSFIPSTGSFDQNGIFYGATLHGLQSYNIETGEAHLTPMFQATQTETDGDGDIWVRWLGVLPDDSCLMEITPTDTMIYLRSDYPFDRVYVNQMMFDRHNRLWLATMTGVYCRDGQKWTYFNKTNSNLKFNDISCLAFDSNDRMWCGTNGGGLFLFDGSDWTRYTTANSPLPSDYIGCVAVDNDNVVWINSYSYTSDMIRGLGLTRFDGTNWETFNRTNSLTPSELYHDIKIDADNNIWLGTADFTGLVCFNGSEWFTYDVENSGIAFNEVTRVTFDTNRDLIWLTHGIGSGLSVARMNSPHSAVRHITIPNTAASMPIYDLGGRQINTPSKGIFIKQGKKYIKK